MTACTMPRRRRATMSSSRSADTGAGMPPEIATKAFDPFFTTKGPRGSGLGLSMVHGFVRQSGGHTRLYSEVGRGTRIDLYLPRAAPVGAAASFEAVPLERGRAGEGRCWWSRTITRCAGWPSGASRSWVTARSKRATATRRWLCCVVPRRSTSLFTDMVMPGGLNGRQLAAAARAAPGSEGTVHLGLHGRHRRG